MTKSQFEREFAQQKKNTAARDIAEFKEPKNQDIRELYRANFSEITGRIALHGIRSSIEDISKIDMRLCDRVNQNFHLLIQINTAVLNGTLTQDML